MHFGWRNGSLCLATLRPDGFAGYVQENKNQEGVIVTKLISYLGGALKLTADVERGGSIKITVLDGNGRQIAAAKSITNSITNEMLQINNIIKEENISLKIEIKKVKVYSFSIE